MDGVVPKESTLALKAGGTWPTFTHTSNEVDGILEQDHQVLWTSPDSLHSKPLLMEWLEPSRKLFCCWKPPQMGPRMVNRYQKVGVLRFSVLPVGGTVVHHRSPLQPRGSQLRSS